MGCPELAPRPLLGDPWHPSQVRAPTGPCRKLGAGHAAGRWCQELTCGRRRLRAPVDPHEGSPPHSRG